MWISKRLDLNWVDFVIGFAGCLIPGRRDVAAQGVERLWSLDGDAIACLSVRSGFDLLLSACAFPRGSEIILSALTISDMPRIVEHHGLVPVPVDIDRETTSPLLDELRQAVGARTKAVVVTHLYGSRLDIDPIVELCREKGILLFEDCAQAFGGRGFTGHPASDVTMFSFGPIKNATALGGGLLRVRDPALRDGMRARLQDYPVFRTSAYAGRLLKYAALHVISGRLLYGAFTRFVRALGRDHDRMIHHLTRGFSGPGFFDRIRRRPCTALLRLLARRLRQDHSRLHQRTRDGERLLELLPDDVASPAGRVRPHHYWVFPILVRDPRSVISALRAAGFDATAGRSFDVVTTARRDTTQASEVLAHAVFLPFYPELPAREWTKMAAIVARSVGEAVSAPVAVPLEGSSFQD